MTQTLGWRTWGKLLLVFHMLLLAGCSQTTSNVGDTLQEAFLGLDDVDVSPDTIRELPYASTYVRINNGQRVFMVLAFAEKNPRTGDEQLKWMAQDGGMIVTEKGRIVKTYNLFTTNLSNRTASAPMWRHNMPWFSRYDWAEKKQYGYVGNSNLFYLGKETLITPLWTQELSHWQEDVTFPDLHASIHNQYWVNKENQVLKSIQYLGPELARIEMTILKPYVDVQS